VIKITKRPQVFAKVEYGITDVETHYLAAGKSSVIELDK
jgi:hypothetical protein